MANIPADLRYTKEHEYVKQTGADAIVQIGITDYAQGELGDVVFVDLPKVGAVRAPRGDGDRGEQGARGRPRAGESRSLWRGLDDQAAGQEHRGARPAI